MSETKEPPSESTNRSLEIEKSKKPPIPAPRVSISIKSSAIATKIPELIETNNKTNHCDKNTNETTNITKLNYTNGLGFPAKTILKKSVSFDPDDDNVKKFTSGEVIIDQHNPFKKNNGLGKQKKTPPPVPIKYSTLSTIKQTTPVVKTSKITAGNKEDSEFVTTEEVLKQSKYVKTYIKNPDKYFEYDPTVLARLKFEELKELSGSKPPKKVKLTQQTQDRLKDLKKKCTQPVKTSKIPNFKKVSKPNYPDLSDIKVKVGTDLEDSLFNPDEVTKNAKKFDERVKKLQICSDDDLEDIDEPLTKSDSSEEVKSQISIDTKVNDDKVVNTQETNGEIKSFTNTVNSEEFQEFLKKKGLSLTPKRSLPKANGTTKTNGVIATEPTQVQIIIEKANPVEQIYSDPDTPSIMDTPKKTKKPSVFQRLLPNGIFSSKRKTTPKEQNPIPQSVYGNTTTNENGNVAKPLPTVKRVVLERQSFHGNSENGILNNVSDLKKQMERSRKSYAAGEDHSNKISSALSNTENLSLHDENHVSKINKKEERSRSASEGTLTKAHRSRSSSKERLHTSQSRDGLSRSRIQRAQIPISSLRPMPAKCLDRNTTDKQIQQTPHVQLRRSAAERQSLVPKRSTPQTTDKRVIFGRCSSMDRNDISKRTGPRLNSLPKSKSASSTPKGILTPKNSKENLLDGGPKLTSTPIRENLESKKISPQVTKPSVSPIEPIPQSAVKVLPVGQQEWFKLSEIKERTDRDLYNKVIQQTQSGIQKVPINTNLENVYERLPAYQIQVGQTMSPPYQPIYAQLVPEANFQNFIRGSPQRNTFSGIYRNRNAKIIDGNPIHIPENQQIHSNTQDVLSNQVPRCQSVLDEMMVPNTRDKGYRSDSETPVIMRKKEQSSQRSGSLTREEILQKVKDFCRKSLNKTPTKLGSTSSQLSSHKEVNDISPVSYVSVETHNRPSSRVAAPQVPQRMQSLPSPTTVTMSTIIKPQNSTPTTSPIYAHVIKRNSIQSNVSDQLDSPQRRVSSSADFYHSQPRRIFGQSSETDSGVFGRPDTASPARFVVMDSEKVTPAHLMKYGQYGQVQMPSPYGFIQVKPQPQNRPRIDGRTTPLILERSNQVGSQIYWSPTRALQHSSRLPVQLSPRYAPQAHQHLNRQQGLGAFVAQPQQKVQQQHQQSHGDMMYVKVQDQIYHPINMRPGSAGTMPHLQQRVHKLSAQPEVGSIIQTTPQHQAQPLAIYPQMYESESGSEAGEVQRIMGKHRIQDWQNEKTGRSQQNEQVSDDRRRSARREDPRRHTLGGDMLQYGGGGIGVGGVPMGMGNAGGGMGVQGQPPQRAMDLEVNRRYLPNTRFLYVSQITNV